MSQPTAKATAAPVNSMNRPVKWLFTAISVVVATVSVAAIVTEVSTASTRYAGMVALFGSDAVWVGQTGLLLAALPLLVWLPQRWVGWAGAVWWLVLMVWIFSGI